MQSYERDLGPGGSPENLLTSARDRMINFLDSKPSATVAMEDFLDMYHLEVALQLEYCNGRETQLLGELVEIKRLGSESIRGKMEQNKSGYRDAMASINDILISYQKTVPFIGSDSPEVAVWARARRADQTAKLMKKDFDSFMSEKS